MPGPEIRRPAAARAQAAVGRVLKFTARQGSSGVVTAAMLLALLTGLAGLASGDATATSHSKEEAIMLAFRQAINDADPLWTVEMLGWQPNSLLPHCKWKSVRCNTQSRVTSITLKANSALGFAQMLDAMRGRGKYPRSPPGSKLPLLAELAQLQYLEKLMMDHVLLRLPQGIPIQWFQPAAFPRLRELRLIFGSMQGPLPDSQPGMLRSLTSLQLTVDLMQTTLPASWGATPDVMPNLTSLTLEVQFQGTVPAAWAGGFRQLRNLVIERSVGIDSKYPAVHTPGSIPCVLPAPAPGSPPAVFPLPSEWAAPTAFPRLSALRITCAGPAGTFPAAWEAGGFPSLTTLSVNSMGLAGSLPGQLFTHHPLLKKFSVDFNNLTGTLPASWASSQVETLQLGKNHLSGPAFPAAWLEPGAFPSLAWLELEGASDLKGTLPANLSWPNLNGINLQGSNVAGSIPAAWCQAPFARSFKHLWFRGSGVEPTLPACATTSFPQLLILKEDIEGEHSIAQHAKQRWSAGAIVATALAPLIVAALGALGVVLRRKCRVLRPQHGRDGTQQRSQQQDLEEGEEEEEDEEEQQQRKPLVGAAAAAGQQEGRAGSGGSGCSGRSRSSGLGGSKPLSHRARLAALVQAELGSQASAFQMLPVEALPEALAHHLGAAAAVRGRGRRRQATADAVAQAAAEGEQAGEGESLPLMLPPGSRGTAGNGAAEVELAQLGGSSLEGSGGVEEHWGASSGSGEGTSRRWGLETASLLVPPGDLRFVTAADGQLVDLGTGTHGAVFLAMLQGTKVAVKVYELLPGMDSRAGWQEARLLRNCAHPRIVPLLGIAIKGPLLMLAMEWMQGGSLRAALQDPSVKPHLAWRDCGRQVAADVAEALAYMHVQMQYLHGDLKSSNVLLSADLRGHLADLGVTQWVGSKGRTAPGGTRMYAAPEQLMGQRCTLSADVYSLGLILVELTTGQLGANRGDWRLPLPPRDCPQDIVDLISECIQTDPEQRPSASQVLKRLRSAGSA